MGSTTIWLPDDLRDQVDENLEYGDSRSEFIKEAVKEKLDRMETEGTGGDGGDDA